MNGRNRMFFDLGDSINWFCSILPTIMHGESADPEYDIQTAKNSLKNLASIYFSAKFAKIIIPIWELR